MHYRLLGKTGIETSILGFGAMRLPTTNPENPAAINEAEAIKIIRQAIDGGVNYIDTAYVYHREQGEVLVGKALQDGYREKVTLMTKNPIWKVKSEEDYLNFLEEELKRLQTDHIDVYLFHSLKKQQYEEIVLKFDLLEKAKEAKREGKIRHIGLSSHDSVENIMELIDVGIFEVILLQYNIIDNTNAEVIEYAAKKGLGVCVMGPVAGGRLALEPPKELVDYLTPGKKTFVDLAFKHVWSNPNISVALSGMGNKAMVRENLALANSPTITLTAKEKERVQKISETYKRLSDLICTQCGYCMPCEHGVNITKILKQLIHWQVYGWDLAKQYYSMIGKDPNSQWKNATACIECGECEEKCPQGIPIIKRLKEAHEILYIEN
ncbi:MAG: aldo/keto reductase [Candidatus Heimdallarchaeota archaeon]